MKLLPPLKYASLYQAIIQISCCYLSSRVFTFVYSITYVEVYAISLVGTSLLILETINTVISMVSVVGQHLFTVLSFLLPLYKFSNGVNLSIIALSQGYINYWCYFSL